jgi:hypothetical protein
MKDEETSGISETEALAMTCLCTRKSENISIRRYKLMIMKEIKSLLILSCLDLLYELRINEVKLLLSMGGGGV